MKSEHNDKITRWKRMQADHPHDSGVHGFWEGKIEGFKEGEALVAKELRAVKAFAEHLLETWMAEQKQCSDAAYSEGYKGASRDHIHDLQAMLNSIPELPPIN